MLKSDVVTIKANYGDYMINAKAIHSYLQNHTINDACKHFNCSFKELVNYTNIYGHSEGITTEYDMKYIQKRNGVYFIQKHINGEFKCFKCSKSLKETVEIRDKLIENNWRYYEQLGIVEIDDNQYIYPVGKSFQLKKYINGENRHFGTFKTLEEAIKARDELIMNNWGMLE